VEEFFSGYEQKFEIISMYGMLEGLRFHHRQ
jgi:hypothetical protein